MRKQNNLETKIDKILFGMEQLIVWSGKMDERWAENSKQWAENRQKWAENEQKWVENEQRWIANHRQHRRTHEHIDRVEMKLDHNINKLQEADEKIDGRVTNLETWRNSYTH